MEPGSQATDFTYRLYHDSLNPVALLDSNGDLLQRYICLPDSHTPVAMLRYTPGTSDDPTPWVCVVESGGSVRLVVNALTGEIGQRIDYGSWGEVIDDTNHGFQPFGYAGGEYDWTTGLTRFGARDYDASIGRWTAKDPIGFGGGDTNLYAYVGGEPVNWIDLNGLSPKLIVAGALGVGGCISNLITCHATGDCDGAGKKAGACILGAVGGAAGAGRALAGGIGSFGTGLAYDYLICEGEITGGHIAGAAVSTAFGAASGGLIRRGLPATLDGDDQWLPWLAGVDWGAWMTAIGQAESAFGVGR